VSVPLFLASEAALAADPVVLDGAEGHHAARVRRVRPGERVDVTDGRGRVAECVVASVERDALSLSILGRREVPAPRLRLVVVQALPKGARGELAVETLTEVGADVVVPWAASRCVVQWRGDRGARALGRWRDHAREAAKQARRAWLPVVRELATTGEVAALLRTATLGVVLHETANRPLTSLTFPSDGEIVLVVGPEGGVADDELAAFAAAGGVVCRLGDTVLRTSTAGVAGAAVLLARCGRWS
jgi:16S rRNA (uracil1498-N3)-methyltransferase